MPGKKISLIGSSNLHTNKTCQFGSMAGLAPTKNLRPWITSLPAYKYNAVLNDKNNYTFGCGYNRKCEDGNKCVKKLGFTQNVVQHRIGMKHFG
jgi:hypothetical protein